MRLKLSRSVSPLLVLSAVSLAGCKLDVSLGGAQVGTSTSSGSIGSGVGGLGGTGGEGGAGGGGGGGGAGGEGGGGPSFTPDKLDLLFVVDNSGSMADKQEVLRMALVDLVQGITNPPCVDPSNVAVSVQPSSGLVACPSGLSRVRTPVQDMHIGAISSSLGGHGSNSCNPSGGAVPPSTNDKAHLLARSDETSSLNDLSTYAGSGFLKWDPLELHGPEGESDPVELVNSLSAIVQGVGQAGCGFEAPLESFYRFLVDPEPHNEIVLQDGDATPVGLDTELLQQREDFLRPDSLLVIVMLSDENDCSVRDGGRNYVALETRNGFRMWRPRSECATDPNDPCCKSCSQDQAGCPVDPTCTGPDGNPARLSAAEDPVNARCWDQKRRFGYDFLYPIQRYRNALTSTTIAARNGELVPNPIFMDLKPTDDNTRIRGPQHVVFAGIVGVPWQDVARDPDDLRAGLKTPAELAEPLASGATTWDVILGDPANHVPPLDPFMVESMAPRSGANPITGDEIVPPDEVGWNRINGREYTIEPGGGGDLQYACIFELPTERVCDDGTTICDCLETVVSPEDSPLCKPLGSADPADPGPRSTTQDRAKAYPSLRELHLIRELGERGVAGSICPAQLSDRSQPDFGYRPVMAAVLDRLSTAL